MKLTPATLAAVCVGMTITACQKEQPPQSANHLKAVGNIQEFFNANKAAALNTFTVNPQTGGTFYFQNGSTLVVAPNAIRSADGAVLTENVAIRINTIINRWYMLAFNLTTETEEELLISGGSYESSMKTVSGAAVTTPAGGITLNIPGSLTGGVDTGMSSWEGEPGTQERDVVWVPSALPIQTTPEIYAMAITEKGVPASGNVDKPKSTKSTGVIPRVYLPAEFNATNTEIFVSVNGYTTTLGSLDLVVAGSNGNYWTDNTAFLSQNEACNLIVVAWIDGTLRARIQPFTAAANQNITVTSIPATTTNALRAAVLSLP